MDSLPLEIRISVFEYLHKKDLLSSALACRMWRDVAWDKVMWKTCIICFSGILKALFSGDSSGEIDNDDFTPLASDLKQFLGFAAKTASIRLDIAPTNSRVEQLLRIADSTPGKVLFPRLSSLDCGETPQDDLLHRLFVGSPIKSITIYGGGDRETNVALRRFLSVLLATQPQVQAVDANEVNLPEGFASLEFWRLPELRFLKYRGYISYDGCTKIIQQCPKLCDVALIEWSRRHSIPQNPAPLPAPSLLWLNLAGFWSFTFSIAIMKSIEAPHLKALDLDVASDLASGFQHEEARSAFHLLAERSPHLESLTLWTRIELGVEILAAFRSLRCLRVIDSTTTCELDDGGVESLCRSLPNLSEFYLDCPVISFRGDYAETTPKSFSSFARHCRDLTSLALPVTAINPEDFVGSILTDLVAFGENLSSLEFTTLTLLADRTEDFVSFLVVQCPKITDLEIRDLKIADQEISVFILSDMRQEMEHAYFQAQGAL